MIDVRDWWRLTDDALEAALDAERECNREGRAEQAQRLTMADVEAFSAEMFRIGFRRTLPAGSEP